MIVAAALSLLLVAPQAPDVGRGPTTTTYLVRAHQLEGADGAVPVEVRLRVDHPPRGRMLVQMPIWTPGSYRYRDFPDHVREVSAGSPTGPDSYPVTRLNRHTWEVDYATADAEVVEVRYTVDIPYDSRGMVRGTERRTITYEGPALYMFVKGHLDAPARVEFDIPDDWQVATGLAARPDGSWFAADYDFLADCPVKIGRFQRFEYSSHGKPIEVVVDGPGDIEFDAEPWLANLKKITDTQADIFGGFPFDRYVFLFSAHPGARGFDGGLEHLTSTMIGLSASGLQRSDSTGLGVIAHEFVHLWNVKRMRPIELGPFDYTRPNRSTGLWIAEGFTSYYAQVTLARAGFADEDGFWRSMGGAIRSIENNPAREHVTPADSSYRVWESAPRDRSISYYTTGQVIGLLLDIEIRSRTGNQRSLDDLMRALWAHCRVTGRGFTADEVPAIASEVCGADLTGWFDRYVDGTLVPPYAEILARAGVIYSEERARAVVLRGLRSARGRPDDSDPLEPGDAESNRQGVVLEIDGKAVGDDDTVIDAAVAAAGDRGVVRLVLEGPAATRVEVDAEVVSVPRVQVQIDLDPAATVEQVAVRRGIITGEPRRPH